MAENQALIVQPSRDNWLTLREEATVALKSGFLPQHIKTAEQAIAIAMVGRELGISAWRALTGIKVIQGTPTLSSELMAHLIYRAHGDEALTIEETTDLSCTISYRRRSAKDRKSYTYTMDMANQAGLTGNATYKKHPANMLRARCISNIARMAFPDTIAGCYTEDEASEIPARETNDHDYLTAVSQSRQSDVPVGGAGPALIDSALLPNRKEMEEMADHLHQLTGEEVTIPEMMTRADARKLNALLIDLITQAEAADVAELRGEPVAAGAVRLDL